MNKIKNLAFVIIILFIISVLVIARSNKQNLFKQDVETVFTSAHDDKNTITFSQLKNKEANYRIVDLNTPESFITKRFNSLIHIPFNELLKKENQKQLKEIKDTLILFSENISTSSKAWVILNQLGYSNVYILETEENNEVFKFKFQPDTIVGLE